MKNILSDSLINARKFELFVPPPSLCKDITWEFPNATLIWCEKDIKSDDYTLAFNRYDAMYALNEHGFKCFPAPTLEEIFEDMQEFKGLRFGNTCIRAGNTEYYYPTNCTEALMIWFEIREILTRIIF